MLKIEKDPCIAPHIDIESEPFKRSYVAALETIKAMSPDERTDVKERLNGHGISLQ